MDGADDVSQGAEVHELDDLVYETVLEIAAVKLDQKFIVAFVEERFEIVEKLMAFLLFVSRDGFDGNGHLPVFGFVDC